MERIRGDFKLTDDPGAVDYPFVVAALRGTYWGGDYTLDDYREAVKRSVFISLYENESCIGFARVVSDYIYFAYIDDVYIRPEYRGRGLGVFLMDFVMDHASMKVKSAMLATRDQHRFYENYGFRRREILRK